MLRLRSRMALRLALAAGAVAALASLGAAVVFFLSAREFDPSHHPGTAVAVAIGLAAVVALLTGLGVQRLLARPVRDLRRLFDRAEQGDLFVRAPEDREDELGELQVEFNRLLQKIAALTADVIDSNRELHAAEQELALKEELGRQSQQLGVELSERSLLFDILKAGTSSLSLDEVLGAIAERVVASLRFTEFAILLKDDPSGGFVVRAASGFEDPSRVLGVTVPAGEGVTGLAARSGKPVMIPDVAADKRYLRYFGAGRASGAFLSVPALYHGRVVALLNLLRGGGETFAEREVGIVQAIANVAAITIYNAELFGEVSRLSVTDALTGIGNRRMLEQRFEHEFDRAQRFRHSLALLMFDIDHFKQFNDAHGHPMGDELLRRVAETLRDSLRRIDTVARYGGEEFAVLLPRTTAAEAEAIADKLRQKIASLECNDDDGRPLSATVSVGIAAYPENAVDRDELTRAADDALYEAKRRGRNRLVASERRSSARAADLSRATSR